MRKGYVFGAVQAPRLSVAASKSGGVYKTGEAIVWDIRVEGDSVSGIGSVEYVLKRGGLTEMGRGSLPLKDGVARLSTSLTEPGSVLAEFSATIPGKAPLKEAAGALVSPDRIRPSATRPADFDAFWASKIRELSRVPMNATLGAVDSRVDGAEYFPITLDNIRGTKIQGQLARPVGRGRRPALLIVQWAGVYGLDRNWALNPAKDGWLTLNINAHDLPIDQPPSFYAGQTALQNYPAIGNDDRETSYFLRMYLSCYRAVDYLASRPDWDGKTIVVMGTSQGGLQSLMVAGLHPKITALMANVPAGCDQTGPDAGRAPGWPMWYFQTQGKEPGKVKATSRYYDVVNFASRIRCPALVAVGLIDTVCPPAGVAAAFGQIRGRDKELLLMERSDHQGKNNSQAPYYARSTEWLRSLKEGKKPPIAR